VNNIHLFLQQLICVLSIATSCQVSKRNEKSKATPGQQFM